jgi:protein-disulfide isomerase
MRKLSFISLLFPLLVACGAADSASAGAGLKNLDKKKLAEHVRESYKIPSYVNIDFTEPRDAGIPGMKTYTVVFKTAMGVQKQKLQISENGRHYFLGDFKDLEFDAVADRLSKLKLDDAAVRGPKGAPVDVVEFTDFECPFCQRGYQIMAEQIMKEYDGKVRWYYKSLPLVRIHPWAKPAAMAVECARLQGSDKFWTLHDKIFDAQRSINASNFEEKLEGFAEETKLKMGEFNDCVDGKKTLAKVDADMAESDRLGVESTPMFIVNGRLVAGADYDSLKATIEDELKKSGKSKGNK